MFISYALNKDIDGNQILSDIDKLVRSSIQPNKNYVLTIRLQEIEHYNDDLIKKIEHKNIDSQ